MTLLLSGSHRISIERMFVLYPIPVGICNPSGQVFQLSWLKEARASDLLGEDDKLSQPVLNLIPGREKLGRSR